jgi:hypothetical protein
MAAKQDNSWVWIIGVGAGLWILSRVTAPAAPPQTSQGIMARDDGTATGLIQPSPLPSAERAMNSRPTYLGPPIPATGAAVGYSAEPPGATWWTGGSEHD